MALKRQGMVAKTSGTADLSLTIPANESAVVRRIHVDVPTNAAEDLMVRVARKSIMQFAVPIGWYLAENNSPAGFKSILTWLFDLGLFPPIPIGPGEELSIDAPGANNFMEVVYDLHDAADFPNTLPNGSASGTFTLFQVISNSGVLAAAGDLELDQSDLATEFPQFPGGAVVPSNTTMRLRALFGAGATKGDSSDNGEYTTFLKFLLDREDLFDQDLTGINFLGDVAHIAASVEYESQAGRLQVPIAHNDPMLILFDEPIEFVAGAELNVFATIARTSAAADFVAGEVKLGMIFDVERAG